MQNSLMTASDLANLPAAPDIDLVSLARGTPNELHSFLGQLEVDIPIANTMTKGHAYFILNDGNGRPRIEALTQELTNFALEYAIPRSKINEAIAELAKTNSPYALNALQRDAKNLFTELDKSGEGGELLLFWFAERVLKLPQIISKMSIKTSSNMHFHGSDGVHADIDPTDGLLRLYWCESKIHASLKKAITATLDSINKFLLLPFSFGGTQDNDIRLINYLGDLGDSQATYALKQFLDPKNPNFCSVKNCAICLVGGTSPSYSSLSGTPQEILNQLDTSLRTELPDWISHTQSKIKNLKIEEFIIHVIYVPLPNADDYRVKFKKAIIGGSHEA